MAPGEKCPFPGPLLPVREHKDGIVITVRLTPNANKDQINGLGEFDAKPVLTAKVRAIPDKGKANAALLKLLGKWLGIAKSDLTLKAGCKSRNKSVLISGEHDEILAKITTALEDKT